MAKWQNDGMLDAALAYIAGATTVHVCSAQPSTYTEATSTYSLGSASVTSGTIGAPANATSGRQATIDGSVIGEITISASGTITHVAFVTGTSLLFATTCTGKTVTAGDKVEITDITLNVKDAT